MKLTIELEDFEVHYIENMAILNNMPVGQFILYVIGEFNNPDRKPEKENSLEGFEEFWSRYPRKVAKPAAKKAWQRLSPKEQLKSKIFSAIDDHKNTDQWREGFIPHPATWINQKRWEDEVDMFNYKKELEAF